MCASIRTTYECDEEEDAVYDAESETGLEHGTVFVNVGRPGAVTLTTIVSERTKVDVEASGGEVRAALSRDSTQLVDASDECTDKGEINKRNEEGRVACSEIGNDSC